MSKMKVVRKKICDLMRCNMLRFCCVCCVFCCFCCFWNNIFRIFRILSLQQQKFLRFYRSYSSRNSYVFTAHTLGLNVSRSLILEQNYPLLCAATLRTTFLFEKVAKMLVQKILINSKTQNFFSFWNNIFRIFSLKRKRLEIWKDVQNESCQEKNL